MRRLAIAIAMLFGLLIALYISSNKLAFFHHPQSAIATEESTTQSIAPFHAPSVDGDRLWDTVTYLAQERYSASERVEIRAYLEERLNAVGWVTRQQAFDAVADGQPFQGINIIAEPPGLCQFAPTVPDTSATVTPEESCDQEYSALSSTLNSAPTLIVGAHYDTVMGSPGADDNATGVAALLELAELFSPERLSSEHYALPLKLVLFDGEEEGLLGSMAFVDDMAETKTLTGAIILEMLGYRCQVEGCQQYPPLPIAPPSKTGDFIAVVGDRAHPKLLNAFANLQSDIPLYTLSVPVVAGLSPDLLRSDHVSFWRQGIGAVMVTDTANFRNPHYHQESDRPNTLDREFFTAATQSVIDAVIQLLNR